MQDYYVGRQPIYNKELEIFGYEMLFRNSNVNQANLGQTSEDGATSTTILNIFMEMGLHKLVGTHYASINLTEQFVLNEASIPFSAEQVILEIGERTSVTPELISAIKNLKSRGFQIALDDYVFNPAHSSLMGMADIIKIDIRNLSKEEIIEHIKILRNFKVKLLAEKIENMDEFDFCVRRGFDYYQGYFLGVPRIIRNESLPNNRTGMLRLLAQIHDPGYEVEDIAKTISLDVTISYKLLKLINSSFFNFSREIESLKEIVVIMGRNQLASWVSIMALTSMDDRPAEMVRLAIIRARTCELLAERKKHKSLDKYFTVGLFSALDVLMERELSQLIEPLPLSEDMVAALLRREGLLGETLSCALACEAADFRYAIRVGLQPRDFLKINLEAMEWADSALSVI